MNQDKLKRYGLVGLLILAPIIAAVLFLNTGDQSLESQTETQTETPTAQEPGKVEQVVQRPASINENIFFGTASHALNQDSVKMLEEVVQVMQANPSTSWQIQGHADERGSDAYNLLLGERRAKAVLNYLVSKGVNPSKLNALSLGEAQPVNPAHTAAAWEVNRRVEFSPITAVSAAE